MASNRALLAAILGLVLLACWIGPATAASLASFCFAHPSISAEFVLARSPSLAIAHPLEIETAATKSPSTAVPHPRQCEVAATKSPSSAVPHPREIETPAEKSPSTAVPHPFEVEASGATLSFKIEEACPVEIVIYSVNGRLVRRLESERLARGEHAITWDGRSDDGARAASGVYFARLRAHDRMGNGKLVLVR